MLDRCFRVYVTQNRKSLNGWTEERIRLSNGCFILVTVGGLFVSNGFQLFLEGRESLIIIDVTECMRWGINADTVMLFCIFQLSGICARH